MVVIKQIGYIFPNSISVTPRLLKIVYFFTIGIICFSSVKANAQLIIESSNVVNFNILENNIVEAGLDFQNEFSTPSNGILLSINILPQNLQNTTFRNWHIDIKKNDIDWHNDLNLFVRITGNGTSQFNTSVQNGTSYQQIQDFDNLFFNGTGWINNIPVQLQITGISVTIPSKLYVTELIFTLLDD
jgi:hypothetical protein